VIGDQRAGDARRDVLLGRLVEHLVGEAAVLAARARNHLGGGEQHGNRRHAGPEQEIGQRRRGGIRQVQRLQRTREQREQSGGRDRHRPVAAELGAARHLAADRRVSANARSRSFIRCRHTLQCKVHWNANMSS
jgi:hypothetical protein